MSVDPRAGSGSFLRPLKRLGVPVRLRRLPYADFAFMGNGPIGPVRVGVERKRINELIGCVQDSRFRRRQVGGMLRLYPQHAWLLVEGAFEPDRGGILVTGKAITSQRGNRLVVFHEAGFGRERHVYENLAKFQATLQIKATLKYMRTISDLESLAWLAALYRWYQKPWSAHKGVYVVDESRPEAAIMEEDTLKRRIAAQLPGVAWSRSKQVDEYFPSIRSMVLATERQWMEALGIQKGRKIARHLIEVCNAVGSAVGAR